MSSLLGYRCVQSVGWLGFTAGVAAVALLSSCSTEKAVVNAKSGPAGPPVAVVVTPVVQKTVPILMELTARRRKKTSE